jgi:hypothetical protein
MGWRLRFQVALRWCSLILYFIMRAAVSHHETIDDKQNLSGMQRHCSLLTFGRYRTCSTSAQAIRCERALAVALLVERWAARMQLEVSGVGVPSLVVPQSGHRRQWRAAVLWRRRAKNAAQRRTD